MKRMLIVLAVVFSLTLVSCGGSGSGANTTINVTMTDFQFQPNHFTVPAGQEIKFNASNNGGVVHNFVIMKLGTTAGDTFDDADAPNVYWEAEAQPGVSINTTFTAPSEPGDYEVVCSTPGHIVAGMVAKMTVVSAGK